MPRARHAMADEILRAEPSPDQPDPDQTNPGGPEGVQAPEQDGPAPNPGEGAEALDPSKVPGGNRDIQSPPGPWSDPETAAAVLAEDPAAELASEDPAAPVPGSPSLAATVTVPPLEGSQPPAGEGEGGEWELLTAKLRDWLGSGQLQELWQQARTPLNALLAVVLAALVLRIYGALLGALNGLPLVPGLLELVGLIWLLRRGVPKLLRSSERRQIIDNLQGRWQAFRGGR